ncbi:MAG: HAD family hydrolase [Roseburia sp.]
MVKAVIFDMDGVLIDTEKWLNKYWCQAAEEAGFPMRPRDALAIRSLAAKYAEPYLQEIYGSNFCYSAIRARRKELMSAHIEKYGIEKKDGVDEILAYLKSRNIRTAVATATDPVRAESYLTQIGIRHQFDRVICATMVANGKPKPDIYLYACADLGEQPGDCIAIEDSPNGVCSAAEAGLRTIMVPDLTRPDQETASRIVAEVDTLHDIIGMLEKEIL